MAQVADSVVIPKPPGQLAARGGVVPPVSLPPAEPPKVGHRDPNAPAATPLPPPSRLTQDLQRQVDETLLAKVVTTALAAQVEVPGPGGSGTGTIVEKRHNRDGSTTYFVLTAKHVVSSEGSGHYMSGKEPEEGIQVPRYVITQSGAFPLERKYRDPSGKDLALFSFVVPPGRQPLPVAKVSADGAADLSGKSITLVGGAPNEFTRPELRAEGAHLQKNGVLCSYISPVPSSALPVGQDEARYSHLPPGLVSFPSDNLPTEEGTSGSGYVGRNGVAGVHRGVSSRQDEGPDKGSRTYVTPVNEEWVRKGVEALERGAGPDVRIANVTPQDRVTVEAYYEKYDLPTRLK